MYVYIFLFNACNQMCGLFCSILESPICNTIRSIVPLRSQLSLKGYVFHEYLSSLAHISRSESSRLSEAVNNSNQRRKRVARNYLSNGALSLSSEDISLLDQYKCYQKHSSETKSES
ncbi:putative checkpoint protein Rad17/Rad24 [Helianthus anomalus]